MVIEPTTDFRRFGFSFLAEPLAPFVRLHRHDEIEFGMVEGGAIRAMFGARTLRIPPERLLIFWAGQPHGPVAVDPGVRAYAIHVPLAQVLDWNLPAPLTKGLLHGDVLLPRNQGSTLPDGLLMRHWIRLMKAEREELRAIVLLELEARLRRLGCEGTYRLKEESLAERSRSSGGQAGQFERIARVAAERCRDPLSVKDIARSVSLHPNYMMRLFRQVSGMTILEYLAQQRVGHAQRLLATTDLKIIDVAMESGFGSVCRFYKIFWKHCGTTPRQYRQGLRR